MPCLLYTSSIERKKETRYAPLLFNLAELQNECSKRFKISPDETLKITQELYEKKLVTYPRTDARVDVYKRQWYIYTDEKIRRQRLKESRGYSDERIDQIFRSQKTHEEFQKRCMFMIDNNGSEEETFRQIDRRMKE